MTEPRAMERNPTDARAWFYLDHRDDIETWAALRDDARDLLEGHLLTLEGAVGDLAAELDAEPFTADLDDGAWPRFGLRAPHWTFGGTQDVSVVLEWERSALLRPGPNEWPFVAVRLEEARKATNRWAELHSALAPARKAFAGEANRPWPIWRYVQPAPGSTAVHPAALADSCMADLHTLWQVVRPVLDAVHTAHFNESNSPGHERSNS